MQSTKTKAATKASARAASLLVPASEDLKEWAALLGSELVTWPGVRTKLSFGMMSYYRKKRIFAMLPKTRAMMSENSILVKFHRENTETRKARTQLREHDARGWVSFELTTEKALGAALRWLELAYRMAK